MSSLDQYRVEHVRCQMPADGAALPVFPCSDWPYSLAQRRGQCRPDHNEVEMARVIAEIDALPRLIRIAVPLHGQAAYQSTQACDTVADLSRRSRSAAKADRPTSHRPFTSASMRRVRRTIVTREPATMMAR